jgi:heme/copper-type cytochrome/quinol oxidase subunit 4
MSRNRSRAKLHDARVMRARNLFLLFVSIYAAVELYRTGAIESWILAAMPHIVPGSFIAGMGFTSLFTLAPASIVLMEIANVSSPLVVALIGAAGAVLGDLFLFMFMRGSADGAMMLLNAPLRRRVRYLLHHRLLHWVLPITGAIIIASPLPDELGLALMGFSRMRLALFVPISYVMNFLGILGITMLAQAIL